MSVNRTSLGKRISFYRSKSNLTQEVLAAKVNCSREYIERAAEAYGKKGKIEAQHLAFELTELFASGNLTPQDMDGIMYEMHKAYFKYREQKREKERIMNL